MNEEMQFAPVPEGEQITEATFDNLTFNKGDYGDDRGQ